MPGAQRSLHVVAGLIVDSGRVCLSRRRIDAHQGGKWEFPGGKLETGEAARAGLVRELHEELGIDVEDAQPYVRVRHSYSDLDVLLDVWKVLRYRGAPHGREAQQVEWFDIGRLQPNAFPDADRWVVRRLQLPPLYLISDTRRFGEPEFLDRLTRALDAGVRLVQLREPEMERRRFGAYARDVAERCRRYGARFLINADPSWVTECDADGVHLSSARLRALTQRPLDADQWVAASCHGEGELQLAERLAVDFVVLGPVAATHSHPQSPILGWREFERLTHDRALPTYALGGMGAVDMPAARAAGAVGISVISAAWGRSDIDTAVREILSQ